MLDSMSELVLNDFPTRDQIDLLQREMSRLPQVELPTEHYFSDAGMYCRKVFRPAGTIVVGKVHKHPHLFICALGEIKVWTDKGIRVLKAGDVVESAPGTKRVTLALTDAIGITVHRTESRDLLDLEAELVEADESAMFDAGNLPRIVVDLLEDAR